MVFEAYQPIAYQLTNIFAAAAAVLSVVFLFSLFSKHRKEKSEIAMTLLRIFFVLAVTYVFYAIAEIWYSIVPETPGIPDLFWIAGYIIEFIALSSFILYVYRKKEYSATRKFTYFSVVIIVLALVFLLINIFFPSYNTEEKAADVFLDYFYPMGSALLTTASIFIYSLFTKIPVMGKPLLWYATANVLNFLGDVLWLSYTYFNIYGVPGVISDTLYFVSYAVSAYAFFKLIRPEKNANILDIF